MSKIIMNTEKYAYIHHCLVNDKEISTILSTTFSLHICELI